MREGTVTITLANRAGATVRVDRAKPLLLLESGAALSYGEAERGAARFAALFALLELLPGDRVAVQVEKSPEALLVYLACLRAGLVYLPLNSAYHEGEVAYFLVNAEPRAVIAQPQSMPWLGPLAARLGIRHVFSLDDNGSGTLLQAARVLVVLPVFRATHVTRGPRRTLMGVLLALLPNRATASAPRVLIDEMHPLAAGM